MLVTVTVHGVTAGCCDCWLLPFLDTLYSTLWDYDSKTVRLSLLVRSSSKPLNPVSGAYRSLAIAIVDYLQPLERQPKTTAIASVILGSLRLHWPTTVADVSNARYWRFYKVLFIMALLRNTAMPKRHDFISLSTSVLIYITYNFR